MVVNWSQKVRPETLKVAIEIDQQAQSDGLCKIKAVNNDPVSIPRMNTATTTITSSSSTQVDYKIVLVEYKIVLIECEIVASIE